MSDQETTQQEVNKAADNIAGSNPQATQAYIDEQLYMRDTLQSYLNKISGKDEKDTDRQRQIFVTMSRGIISDISAANPQATITRNGEYTWRGVFDLAWEALYASESEEPGKEEPVKEEEPVTEAKETKPQGTAPTPTRRTPGDITPVADGEELEGYVEKLGLKDYAEERKLHTLATKTLSGARSNMDSLRKRIENR